MMTGSMPDRIVMDRVPHSVAVDGVAMGGIVADVKVSPVIMSVAIVPIISAIAVTIVRPAIVWIAIGHVWTATIILIRLLVIRFFVIAVIVIRCVTGVISTIVRRAQQQTRPKSKPEPAPSPPYVASMPTAVPAMSPISRAGRTGNCQHCYPNRQRSNHSHFAKEFAHSRLLVIAFGVDNRI
jgi:hypothetical protein